MQEARRKVQDATLHAVLAEVNASAGYRHEPAGRDYWQTPDELRASGAGDCEDFAIAYWAALRGQCPPPQLACLVLDGQRETHMVCLCGEWVLDVLADAPYRLQDREDVLFLAYVLGERNGGPAMWVDSHLRPATERWRDVWRRMQPDCAREATP